MNKRCERCDKSVYPIEELKCLDKIWHKTCFKCHVCGMTLNMKNYKGYDKKPFCVAHYPTTKFTSVADTPENRRIATNTKLQSSIKYHEDFEKQKGKRITITDDPELQRIKQNTQIQSEINYKGIKQTRDSMEQRRPDQAPQAEKKSAPAPKKAEKVEKIVAKLVEKVVEKVDIVDEKVVDKVEKVDVKIVEKVVDKVENVDKVAKVEKVEKNVKAKELPKEPKKAPPNAQNPYAGKGIVSKAIYDYSAADTDEVSFIEGDIIIHCQPIDQGWMEGTVERTGIRGMLPSNYVQPA